MIMILLIDPRLKGPFPGWFWESSSDLEGFPFQGQMATYGGGGFNIDLGNVINYACHPLDCIWPVGNCHI